MDWNATVERNRESLKRVVAMLAAMAGLGGQFTFFRQEGGGGPECAQAEKSKLSPALTLPRRLHRAVVKLLRPAEAAVRRLIIVAARGFVIAPPPRPQRPKPGFRRGAGPVGMPKPAQSPPRRVPQLPLLDPLRLRKVRAWRAAGSVPRISFPGFSEPFRIRPRSPEVDATRLAWRLEALVRALDDLPGQAKRFARWRARATGGAGGGDVHGSRRRVWPLKPGRPPGWRRKPSHEVHAILDVVHGLAFWALEQPDTS